MPESRITDRTSPERVSERLVADRKVSQCSKNEVGAMNYASIKSVVETARLRGHDPVKILAVKILSQSIPLIRYHFV